MNLLAIAHVLSSFGMGGQERVAFDLARSHAAQGHRVIAVSLAPPPHGPLAESFAAAGIPTYSIGRGDHSGPDPGLLLRLRRILAEHGTHVVHTHNPSPLIYAPLPARSVGAAVIHTKHGKNPSSRTNLLARRAMARLVSYFVCVSEKTAEQARGKRECRHGRLRVIPNGIDTDAYASGGQHRSIIRGELGIDAGVFVFGTVGRLDANKNHALMLDAFANLPGEDTHLVIVGDGPTRQHLDERARRDDLAGRVHLTGTRRDVPALLASFDAFVLSSDSEGLPLVIPEAMAAGLPVISTNVGGIADVVEDGASGILVQPGDRQRLAEAMARVLGDRRRAHAMGDAGRRRATAHHSLAAMAARYLELYRDATNRHPSP